MGTDKALIIVDGRPLAGWVAGALREGGCDEVVAIGGDVERLGGEAGLTVVVDVWPGEGPLGAVVTALEEAARRGMAMVVVAPCDLPGLTAAAVAEVAREAGTGTSVGVAGGRHSLLTAWSVTIAPALRSVFEEGERRILTVLDGAVRVELPDAVLRNVNRPDDLQQ